MGEDSGRLSFNSLCTQYGGRRPFFSNDADSFAADFAAGETPDQKRLQKHPEEIVEVRFHIPGALREFAGGRSQVEVQHPPATLNGALTALWTLCPGMRDRVVTEQGEIRPHINIFVGEENIRYTGGLATRVTADAIISIVPAVSGGDRHSS